MFVARRTDGLQFNDQAVFHEQIRKVFAERRAVFIINGEWMLLFDVHSLLSEPVPQSILVDLFKMAAPVILVNGKNWSPE